MRYGQNFGGGFNLPPGCGKLPGEEEFPCEVCGRWGDNCICPECPKCHSCGDPECYERHGMVRTQKQIESKRKADKAWDDFLERERQMFDEMREELS